MTISAERIRVLLQSGRAGEAVQACAAALARDPNSSDLLLLMGAALQASRRSNEAIRYFSEAATLAPQRLEIWGEFGICLAAQNRHQEAIAALEKARQIDPNHPLVHYNLANSLAALGRHQEAVPAYECALKLKRDHHPAWHNLGLSFMRLQRTADALECFVRALAHAPDSLEYQISRASCLLQAASWSLALAAYREILARHESDWRAHAGLANTLLGIGNASASEVHALRAIALCGDTQARLRLWSNYLLSLQYRDDITTERLALAHQQFPLAGMYGPPARPQSHGNRRIHIGYLSGDLCGHPVGRILLSVLRAHDRDRFRVSIYCNTPAQDAISAEIKASAESYHSVLGLPAQSAASEIRADELDVLIDLSGHTAHNRLDVLAAHPASRQMGWLGYPGPYAPGLIDGRLSDVCVDPPQRTLRDPVLHVSGCMLAFGEQPPPAQRGIKVRPFAFCSFNNLSKISDLTLRLWREILLKSPATRMLLKGRGAIDAAVQERIRGAMGDVAGRIELRDWAASTATHLAAYGEAEIALDTYPYGGTTTTCEALATGVPVVSLAGDRPAARMGLTLLTAAGHPGYAVSSEDDYIALACALAAQCANGEQPAVGLGALADISAFTRRLEETVCESWFRHFTAPRP